MHASSVSLAPPQVCLFTRRAGRRQERTQLSNAGNLTRALRLRAFRYEHSSRRVTHSSLYAQSAHAFARMDLIRTLIRGGGVDTRRGNCRDTMEPPRAAPRVAEPASLTRLWRKADGDVADHVVSFLPTKCLAVLPTLADSFRRDQWRMLGVMMRRQGGRAAGTRAILSTLQVMGRELSHYSEDWQGQADLIPQRWRGCKGGRGRPPT